MKHDLPAWMLALALSFGCAAVPGSAGRDSRAPLPSEPAQALAEIARHEDQRTSGAGRLEQFLEHPDSEVRVRAATALGRLWWPEEGAPVTEALLGGLRDEQAAVRAAAAFALGMRGDPAAGEALAELGTDPARRDPHPLVRARAVEALSKLPREDLHRRVLSALSDVDAGVRIEAAAGTHRWDEDAPGAAEVNRVLVAQFGVERDRQVAEYTLFALQRRAAVEGLGVFLSFSRSPRPLERLFGVRGLKALAPHPDVRTPLVHATQDADWRVACEAVLGLEPYPIRPTYAALDEATQSANPHLRRCAWETIGAQLARPENRADRELWEKTFEGLESLDDDSLSARAAFVGARRIWRQFAEEEPIDPETVREALENEEFSEESWVALAQALGRVPDRADQAAALDVLAHEGGLRAAGAAIEALGQQWPKHARSKLHALLEHPDLGLRLAAVLALAEMPAPEDLPHLARAFEDSTGDIGPEVRFNALRAAAQTGGKRVDNLLRRGLSDPRPFVRRVAREELLALDEDVPPLRPGPVLDDAAPSMIADVPFPGSDAVNQIVALETTRGTMTFELFPGEAPVHVHNFLTIAARGEYDGRIFHRVVPDFVIQGGDYRGDGNGGLTYRGADSLRHEIGPRKYIRGSLGMPRNDDPDSGGSQIFVTHRPTPHLDGRYTIFGELRDGFEVLDAIEVGDRILGVRVLVN